MIARWHEFWHVVGSTAYLLAMPRGSIETLRTGFRARVYAVKDPITGKQIYPRGETRRYRRDAELDAERLVAAVEAERQPDQHATVAHLLDRWVEVVDHELSTAETTAGYIRRTLRPALGDMPVRHGDTVLGTHRFLVLTGREGEAPSRYSPGTTSSTPGATRPASPSGC